MALMTADQVRERNLQDARRVLNAAVKKLKSDGVRVANHEVWVDEGAYFISIETNGGPGSEVVFNELEGKAKYLTIREVSYAEGEFIWESDTYIKPSISAKFSL